LNKILEKFRKPKVEKLGKIGNNFENKNKIKENFEKK